MSENQSTEMLSLHTHPHTVHGKATLKDDRERFWDGQWGRTGP